MLGVFLERLESKFDLLCYKVKHATYEGLETNLGLSPFEHTFFRPNFYKLSFMLLHIYP